MKLLGLTLLMVAAASTKLDQNLFDSSGPIVHRGLILAPGASVAESLIAPFAGSAAPLARIHRDPQATDATAEAIAAALARGLPDEPKDAAAAVLGAPAPVSAALRYEHLPAKKWPTLVAELAAPFGEPNALAEFEGGLLVHAYMSSPGASALDLHEDLGDIVVVQLHGSKTWSFDGDEATLAPGDGLVLPAGTSHVARAEDGPSVHLTLHSIGPDQTSSRRRLSDDDEDRCFPGTDAYCGGCEGPRGSEACEQCIYCTDADTICRWEVPDDYGWPSCCLTVGYEFERAEPCECPGTYDDECDPDGCEDDDDWRYDAGSNGIRGCSWVAKKADKRCARNLEGLDGRETIDACPEACDSCEDVCEDSDWWYYKKAKKDCGWVSKKSKRCKGKFKSPDGVKSKRACREACGNC